MSTKQSAVTQSAANQSAVTQSAVTQSAANQSATGQSATGQSAADFTLLSDDDLHWFAEGTHYRIHDHLGAHPCAPEGKPGTYFAVWAPNAQRVDVVGDWNDWREGDSLRPRANSGIWEGFLPGVGHGALYKYAITPEAGGPPLYKADPFARRAELPPNTASVVWDLGGHTWRDEAWMKERGERQSLAAPMSIYEVHLGSWRRDDGRMLGYRELGAAIAEHVRLLGFTHVELMPVGEHPFYGSWGYQTTSYFAPTGRYGTPQDLMAMIDALHEAGVGVILDWAPAHFPCDAHGLANFNGTSLFEHPDPRRGKHPDWNSCVFDYGRPQVRSFLVSSAMFWLERYHIDGLRFDAVASMLYLDYSRGPGQWEPNQHGGREHLEAISFLRDLNKEVYRAFPDVQTIAEESTAWPLVSRPVDQGGLGFGLKWDMGWMHDTLEYLARDPVHRRHHHGQLTFRTVYQFSEKFVLPLSHDEVVHGKGSLLNKMPGDTWQKFANLRLLLAYMYAMPGKKLLFMGTELAPYTEWTHEGSLPWDLVAQPSHGGVHRLCRDLNDVYRTLPALHVSDNKPECFQWVEADDAERSILAFLRHDGQGDWALCVFNFTPVPRHDHHFGVPVAGAWEERLNTDAVHYGGSGQGNLGLVQTVPVAGHGHPRSIRLTLPPLGALVLHPHTPGP